VTNAEEKLKRLYRLVEDGITDLDEVLKDRLNTLKAERDQAHAALNQGAPVAPDSDRSRLIERFGRMMQEQFTSGSVPFRKAYLQSLITAIEVDDKYVRVKGSKDLIEKAVIASQNGPACCWR
jgi:site-specific DNA recombinase